MSAQVKMMRKPTLIQHENLRFVLMDAPDNSNAHLYVHELQKQKISTLVRSCDPSYSDEPFLQAGIAIHEIIFEDGGVPSKDLVDKWMQIVRTTFTPEKKGHGIAVHCVAGMGRTPVLIALALIENGMDPFDAIELIRKERKGALSTIQVNYLEKYRKTANSGGCCAVM
eukprot:GILK01007592.1.p1 GENE.GILK01007592.1~~GILK01007592.1.p1  ORF type:complete len:169 (+),score=16.84 GILK01007592.1:70-576(+)